MIPETIKYSIERKTTLWLLFKFNYRVVRLINSRSYIIIILKEVVVECIFISFVIMDIVILVI